MRNMKSALLALASTLVATSAAAEITMLPYKDAGWSPDFNLAVSGGQLDPQAGGADTETATGIQLSLNCPWFALSSGNLRQNINYNRVDGDNYDLTTFEFNPRVYQENGDLSYGFGPGFGYMWLKPAVGGEEGTFTLQASAAVEYRIDSIAIGASTRYQYTLDQDIAGSGDGMDNILTSITVGIDF